MRVYSKYPTPVFGVSTLADRIRPEGYMQDQVNMRSDPVERLRKRGFTIRRWYDTAPAVGAMTSNSRLHKFQIGEDNYLLCIAKADKVFLFKNGLQVQPYDANACAALNSYVGGYDLTKLQVVAVDGEVRVLNPNRVVRMYNETDEQWEDGSEKALLATSYINVVSALNYGETVTLRVTVSGTMSTVTYTVPDLGVSNPDYDAADKKRATAAVAAGLYTAINGISGVVASVVGSTVAVHSTSAPYPPVMLTISTGQGDKSIKVINQTIQDTEGLPLYAAIGRPVITVKPDPSSEKGVYYLKATTVNNITVPLLLQECVWTESRAPTVKYKLNHGTLPVTMKFASDGKYYFEAGTWEDRKSGDDTSNPTPEFVDKKITAISTFQNRLVLATSDTLCMSRTNEPTNFWRRSAVGLLVTDPVELQSTSVDAGGIFSMLPHNKDLAVFSKAAQFKVAGDVAITPQTGSMYLTTSYTMNSNVQPAAMGDAIVFTAADAEGTQVFEYNTRSQVAQDRASSINEHASRLIHGNIKFMTASSNKGMLVLGSSITKANELFVFEQRMVGGERKQSAWSRWVFPKDWTIVGAHIIGSKLYIMNFWLDTLSGNISHAQLHEMNLSRVAETTLTPLIFVDDLSWNACNVTTGVVTGLTGINVTDQTKVYASSASGSADKYEELPFTYVDGVMSLDTPGPGYVYITKPFDAYVTLSKPNMYDNAGVPADTGRVRVGALEVSVRESEKVKLAISSPVSMTVEQIGAPDLNGVDTPATAPDLRTGTIKFPVRDAANNVTMTLSAATVFDLAITDIAWEGNFNKVRGSK